LGSRRIYGKISVDEYAGSIDANIGTQSPQIPTAVGAGVIAKCGSPGGGVTAVPEPAATMVILGVVAAPLLARRSRRYGHRRH